MPYKTAFAPGSTPDTAHMTSLITLGPIALPHRLVPEASKPGRYKEQTASIPAEAPFAACKAKADVCKLLEITRHSRCMR